MASDKILERTPFTGSVINPVDSEDLLSFLQQNGIISPDFFPIKSGRNSRVWHVQNSKGKWILKEYYRHPEDPEDRLRTEFQFLEFLHNNYLNRVPTPIACSQRMNLGLYSMLSGIPVKKITDSHIEQSSDFVVKINSLRSLPEAKLLA